MFKKLKSKVTAQFDKMVLGELYTVAVEKDELFNAYIASLPEAERAEHMCNCCRSFLNHYGNIVSIVDGKVSTVWDITTESPYDQVPAALSALVKLKTINGKFLSNLQKLGTDTSRQRLENGDIIKWDHFYVELPRSKVNTSSDSVESIQGTLRATRDVFARSLETITIEATETVLELIGENSLYRGKEFQSVLESFLMHQTAYKKSKEKDLYVWANFVDGGRVRNSAIGTLLVDLSEAMPLDKAVRSFEAKVAPANYKRPTALVTAKMIEQAQKTLVDLGLEKSLVRRHANTDDIPIANVLFVNRDAVVGDVFSSMKTEVPVNTKSFARAKEVTLDDFINNVLPTAKSIDVLVENSSSFMSLIAPEDKDAPNMMSWDNSVSWTYQNNLTDSIKEKVKAAGGGVDGELRVSLEWFNNDDLDLYMKEPDGKVIYFGDKISLVSGGFLDVDMNVGLGCASRKPVENIIYEDKSRMKSGIYIVSVKNHCKRENIDLGFNVQIECQGNIIDMSHAKAAVGITEVATFRYTKETGITDFITTLSESFSQKEVNGVLTNRFQQVNMMMYSPNHWTSAIGNKHLFFIIDKSKVDNTLRPFFNEYLKPSLQEHRKVFEILGSKLMVKPSDQQLSGVGYSLTQKSQVIVRVNNSVIKVTL